MCGRYWMAPEENEGFETLEEKAAAAGIPLKTAGEIFPADTVPVICSNRLLLPRPFAMTWGYSLNGKRVINARSETAAQRPLFAEGMKEHRCLIPAAHYFEWERGTKTKYAIRPAEPFRMAGLYRPEAGGYVFTVLTRAPGEGIAFIHDRMPVLLPEDVAKDWLNPKYRAEELLAHALTEVTFAPT